MTDELPPNQSETVPDEVLANAIGELIGHLDSGSRPVSQLAAEPSLDPLQPADSAEGCPEPGDWLRLASGEISKGAQAGALLTHASACAKCAARLRLSRHIGDAEVSSEDAAGLAALSTNSSDFHRRLAAQLAATPTQPYRSPLRRAYIWAGTGLAASLLLGGILFFFWQRANSPERALAQVYGRSRVFALRIPGARWSAVSPGVHIRGGSSGREPADLLDARSRIASRLERAPQDPRWLELEARSDLIEENFDPAVDILDRLIAAGPPNAGLLADAAAAYFQRGAATGSENDRATALDYLRRADELNPSDPIVLFNEALVMEDRGQMMNAVETWNRFLSFERDPEWLAEGRSRLAALEQKLNRLKTHQSRMQQHLSSPQAMRALAADPGTLAAIDEEFSSSLLPGILSTAFPLPVDRSRGSPCEDPCQAARTLLQALADSLERNHRDPWLTRFLPAASRPPPTFLEASQSLGEAIHANAFADFPTAEKAAAHSRKLFHVLGNAAGEDRAQIEESFARQRASHFEDCRTSAQQLLNRDPEFAWIRITAGIEFRICDTGPGTASEETSAYDSLLRDAQDRNYSLLELRAWTVTAGTATESGDSEETWRIELAGIRRFYQGDYPSLRLMNLLSELAEVERNTPRVRLNLLLAQEVLSVLELTESRNEIPAARLWLATAAIRAGAVSVAEEQIRRARSEQASLGSMAPMHSVVVESEIAMADSDVDRGELKPAIDLLASAQGRMADDDNSYHQRMYAAARGKLELALGHPDVAESTLRDAILEEERQGNRAGEGNVVFALENRDLYALLAGVWLDQKRPAEEILALWERYRLRILGMPVPACAEKRLDCLKPQLAAAVDRLGSDHATGQIVLFDRILIYQAGAQGVTWDSAPFPGTDVLAAAQALEQAASSPTTSRASIDQAAGRVGDIIFVRSQQLPKGAAQLLLEPDPLLGNLPWPAVEVSGQPIGLRFNLEETPSLLLRPRAERSREPAGAALVVGASIASGELAPLPEALSEARDVALFVHAPRLLLAADATEMHVADAMASAPSIHFAGHAVRRYGTTRLLLAGGAGARAWVDSDLLRRHPPRAARLAVFSACATGKRETGWNHDMGDIVNTLAALGVPEVVATRWQIDSAAVAMMDTFYGGLSQGLSVSSALTRARSSLSRDPRYWHPYYWAAYYASGTGATDLSEVIHGGSK